MTDNSFEQVARFLADQVEAWGRYSREDAIADIERRFGDKFLRREPDGSVAIRQELLASFTQLAGERVRWDDFDQSWSVDYCGAAADPPLPAELEARYAALSAQQEWLQDEVNEADSQLKLSRGTLEARQRLSRARTRIVACRAELWTVQHARRHLREYRTLVERENALEREIEKLSSDVVHLDAELAIVEGDIGRLQGEYRGGAMSDDSRHTALARARRKRSLAERQREQIERHRAYLTHQLGTYRERRQQLADVLKAAGIEIGEGVKPEREAAS
jgi:chromosome segregation ATPase